MPSPSINDSNLKLCDQIAQRIANSRDRRITFAEYMEQVLYDPQQGYYAINRANIGAAGDFITAPHLGADFGELLAEQLADMWQQLDRPTPFTVVEMGAGQGILVQDILRYLHKHQFDCFAALEYVVIEDSPALRQMQQHRFSKLVQSWGHLHWRSWEEIPPESIVGCCFSNELVDAFPVHQVTLKDGRLQEVYVIANPTLPLEHPAKFGELVADCSSDRLQTYFNSIDISLTVPPYREGYRTEVNLAALDWLATVADRLQRGYVLTIDYGYPASRYYSPTRSQGTLQCYYQHAYHGNPYLNIGRQDLTAHVDFTALEQQGERSGLQTVGFTQQGLFLMALGLGDRLAALSDPIAVENQTITEIFQRRQALHALIDPGGLGGFGVLIQSKGIRSSQLKGLQLPD
ncbi:MAG: class I SAM-dependent methyltransferase [Leptolyngbyaceae cyanobacterium SL_7_1]|nr:class I SAM-dependent methyltransferase [Leptolyngbyaceae cyanobacterium SL_7_1]